MPAESRVPSCVMATALAIACVVGCSATGGGDGTPSDDAGSESSNDDSIADSLIDTSPSDAGSPDSSSGDTRPPADTGSVADTAAAVDTAPVDTGVVVDTAPPPPTSLDLHDCPLTDNPTGVADWPVTTTITSVEFEPGGVDGVHVEFDKRDGAGRWPDITPPGWTGPLQYTLGFCERIGGKWYGSAAIQFWYGLNEMGGNVAQDIVTKTQCTAFGLGSSCQVAKNWYYDGRWGALAGYQPATDEIIGVFVAAGNLRGVHDDGSQSPVHERSNVVLVKMPGLAGAKYTF